MNYLKDVLHLFVPKLCITCTTKLLQNEKLICTLCRHDLPIICYNDYKDNKIKRAFDGRIPIEMATSFLFYRKNGKTKELIHSLKYKNNQKIGTFIGDWFGNELKTSNEFDDIDCIIPVPLHSKKLKQRGYNQLTTFGISLAKHINAQYTPNVLIKTATSKTQTFKQRFERFNNNDTKFRLTDTSTLKGKHVLLIDDVITTGATLEACSNELLKTDNIKISIVTMAYTE
mgnify:CR=1 FL=1